MLWIKSGIENHSKSEVIGHCDGDEKNECPHRTDKSQTLKYLFIDMLRVKQSYKLLSKSLISKR